jgi:MFS family permease
MRASLAPIAPVLLGVLIAEVALGMLTTLIPLSLSSRGIMAGTIGLVGSGYFLGFLIGTLTCARLVRAVGHIRAFAVFAALGADCALLMTTTHSPWVWAGLRLVMGWQMSGLFLVAESWLNDKADSTTRGRTFGAYLLGRRGCGPPRLWAAAEHRYGADHGRRRFRQRLASYGAEPRLQPAAG